MLRCYIILCEVYFSWLDTVKHRLYWFFLAPVESWGQRLSHLAQIVNCIYNTQSINAIFSAHEKQLYETISQIQYDIVHRLNWGLNLSIFFYIPLLSLSLLTIHYWIPQKKSLAGIKALFIIAIIIPVQTYSKAAALVQEFRLWTSGNFLGDVFTHGTLSWLSLSITSFLLLS